MSFQLHLPEYNQKTQRNVKNKCQLCKEDFSILRRQHICKRCFRSVCDDDSPFKVNSYRKDKVRRLHRMCRYCHLESQVLNKYIQKNKLTWAKDSQYAKIWLKQYKNSKDIDEQIQTKQSQMYFSNDQEIVSMTQLWQSLNFSFRQFIGIAMDTMNPYNQQQAMKIINSGLLAIGRKKVSQLSNAIYILLFFLTHLSLPNSIFMTLQVIKIINKKPPEIQCVLSYLEQLGCNQAQLYKLQSFLQDIFHQLVNKLTLNMFTAQMSIQIITLIVVNKNSQQLQKGIAFVLWQRRQFICQNSSKTGLIFDNILKNISSANYKKRIKDLKSKQFFSQNQSIKVKKIQYDKIIEQNKKLKQTLQEKQNEIIKLKSIRKESFKQSINEEEASKAKKRNRQTQQTDPKEEQIQGLGQDKQEKTLIKFNNTRKQSQQHQQSYLSMQEQEHWSELVQDKNNQISKLKQKLKQIQHHYKQICQTNEQKQQRQEQQKQQRENKIKEQQKQIEIHKKQAESMKNMNNLLLMKMNQLSELIMDKQQKMLKQNEQNQENTFQQENIQKKKELNKFSEEFKQYQKQNGEGKGECIIY